MLVLARKEGETLKIGDDIEIMVVRISQGVVRIGISAPKDTQILRPDAKQQQPAAGDDR